MEDKDYDFVVKKVTKLLKELKERDIDINKIDWNILVKNNALYPSNSPIPSIEGNCLRYILDDEDIHPTEDEIYKVYHDVKNELEAYINTCEIEESRNNLLDPTTGKGSFSCEGDTYERNNLLDAITMSLVGKHLPGYLFPSGKVSSIEEFEQAMKPYRST